MLDRLERYWRVCATALCFAGFGLGSLVLSLVIFPLVRLLIWSPHQRSQVSRDMVRAAMQLFVWFMRSLGVLTYEVRGAEKFQREGLLIMANHPSLIDVAFLIALLPRPDCVVKAPLLRNAFTRGPVSGAGFITNDHGTELIDDAVASLQAGNNLIIFPEGTRTPRSGELRLLRGAANIAVRGRVNITPVIIRCAEPTLVKGEKWYRVPERRAQFDILVGEDIAVAPFIAQSDSDALAVRHLTDYLTKYFVLELARVHS